MKPGEEGSMKRDRHADTYIPHNLTNTPASMPHDACFMQTAIYLTRPHTTPILVINWLILDLEHDFDENMRRLHCINAHKWRRAVMDISVREILVQADQNILVRPDRANFFFGRTSL